MLLSNFLRRKKLLKFQEAPSYLQFNPFIETGYRTPLSYLDCVRSVLSLHNETLNIWTHLLGFLAFSTLLLWDSWSLHISEKVTWSDIAVILGIITCYQACMILSVIYHTFTAHSEQVYNTCLYYDLAGIAVSLIATYISGIYYAFFCDSFWRNFYLVTVILIVIFAIIFWNKLNETRYERERLIFFTLWAVYGTVPTIHWIFLNGGFQNEIVRLFLPRICLMYLFSGIAFFFYLTKFPERLIPGKFDILGSSHQLWHVLIFMCLAYWHNTGYIFAEFWLTNGCNTAPPDPDILDHIRGKFWINF